MLSFSGYINDKTFSWTAHVLKYLLIIWKLFHYGSVTHILNSILLHYTEWKLWSSEWRSCYQLSSETEAEQASIWSLNSFNKKTEHLVQVQQLWLSIFYHYSFTLYLCCSLYWYSILCNNVIDIIILLLPLATATLRRFRLRREKWTQYTMIIFSFLCLL